MVGLCLTFENMINYGTQLQCFATLKAVQELGYPCEIIIYHKQYKLKDYILGVKRLFTDGSLKALFQKRRIDRQDASDTPYGNGIRLRNENVRRFKEEYLFPYSVVYTGYDELKEKSVKYSTVICGSDQIWLPSGFATGFFNLMFAPEGVHRISYASSFGVSKIPSYHRKEAKTFLEQMDFVSVREVRGKELVEEYSSKTAKVVVDPTMLMEPTFWEKMCVPIDAPENYIFCYFLGDRRECREQAQKLSDKTGLKIFVFKNVDRYIPEDDDFGDFDTYDAGPLQFISFIKNASYVLTDSFHGTVFSVLFNKQFITFYRNEPGAVRSKNSRIDSILGLLELNDRLYYQSGDIVERANNKIDWDNVNQKASDLRCDSMEYLSEALRVCESND